MPMRIIQHPDQLVSRKESATAVQVYMTSHPETSQWLKNQLRRYSQKALKVGRWEGGAGRAGSVRQYSRVRARLRTTGSGAEGA